MSTTTRLRPCPCSAPARFRSAIVLAATTIIAATLAALAPAAAALPLAAPALLGAATPDNGNRSFGIRPSGAKKPDARATWTYQNLHPGQRLFDHVAVVNISTRPAVLDVYAADAFNTSQGGFDVLTQNKRSTDVGTWVQLPLHHVTVPARSTLIMPFSLIVPRHVEPGDHAGGIVASLKSIRKDSKGNQVVVDNRVGARLYVRVVGKLTPRIEIKRESATYDAAGVVGRGVAHVTYTVHNTGNVRLVGHQSVRISDPFGASAMVGSAPSLPELLPDNSFTFTVAVTKVWPVFLLQASITVDPLSVTGNVDPALSQASAHSWFWAVSWPLLVLIILGAGYG